MPAPLGPIIAVVQPGLIVKLIFFKVGLPFLFNNKVNSLILKTPLGWPSSTLNVWIFWLSANILIDENDFLKGIF